MAEDSHRIEKDSMGEVAVPLGAYYGVETQRAIENFQISNQRFQPVFIRNLALLKLAAAKANMALGLLDKKRGNAIVQAADTIRGGQHHEEFMLDIFQTGSGTSTNMNMNEVIANLAIESLGGKRGDRTIIHPNDHVNLGQSTNDVFPTTIHLAAVDSTERQLLPSLRTLHGVLTEKAYEFRDVVKAGRTHWQDAVPLTLGQEFSGYASMICHGIARIEAAESGLRELAIGGTAVGTGLNTDPAFTGIVIEELSNLTGITYRRAENSFEALQTRAACVEFSGALRTLATDLMKIANDLRILSSGPNTGLSEVELPALQPGSSIMPGKVNPVIPEAVRMVAVRVIANDLTVTLGGQGGEMELNVMMPIMAYSLIESIELEANASRTLAEKCVRGIRANRERCLRYAEASAALATAISPLVGHDKAAEVVKKATLRGKTIREVLTEDNLVPREKLDQSLNLRRMTKGGRT
ncbi:class II fumarate hydratase [Candidatus Bathyarchaeota archaeon]|nr:class II fumarate hydratase [Candidatus Bathyarchaeota archaeon]